MKERLAPFLVLLEARYAPLLFAVAPQAYAVYLWLWLGSDASVASFWFAVMGALGYELVYVGAIAWAEEGRSSMWTWMTALVALLFSVAVAYYVYRSQGVWAWLHAGFPLVAFAYTLNMHTQPKRPSAPSQALLTSLLEQAHGPTMPQAVSATSLAPQPAVAPLMSAPQAAVVNGHKPQEATATRALDNLVTIVFPCPHCGTPLDSKQSKGAATRNGYCKKCKP
jgi:hypothetical protein